MFYFQHVCFLSDLQIPVYMRHPEDQNMLLVNFDPYIFEVIKEAEYMMKLDLDIPESARVLVHERDRLKAYRNQLKVK